MTAASAPKLRPYQVRALEEIEAQFAAGVQRVLMVSPTGCHRRGERVLMFDGSTKAAEDVRVGDRLMGPDSRPRSVLHLCRGIDRMYEVRPTKGEPFYVNGDHLLTLIRTNDKSKRSGKVVDVSVRQWLTWSRTAKHVHKLFRVPVEFPPLTDRLTIDPYFLGLLLGDGNLTGTVGVSKPDREIYEECVAQADSHGLRVRADKESSTSVTWRLVGRQKVRNPLIQSLRALGLWGTTSATKFVPRPYLVASREERLALLAGLMDADGHLSRNTFDFISQSEHLARDVVFVAQSVGLAAYVSPCEKRDQNGAGGTYFRVCISGDLAQIPTRIPRKKAEPRRQKKSVLRTGFSVKELDEEPFYGWTLDGDGRYLLADFTVTHNSGKTVIFSEFIRQHRSRGQRILFLAAARELIHQTSEKLRAVSVDHGIIMAGVAPKPTLPVQVASIQTLIRRALPPADIICVDEADLARAKTYERIIGQYENAIVFGATASPWRADGKGLGRPHGLFDASVLVATPRELMDQGFLVDYDAWGFEPLDTTGIKTTAGDYDQRELGKRATETSEGQRLAGDVVQQYITRARGRRAVCFGVTVEHSKMLAARFRDAGVPAEHIDGEMPNHQRDAIVARVRSGETLVVCNVGILTRGVDIPALEVCILARATKSLSLYLQMVGRVLRPSPDTGKTQALILDHSGCIARNGIRVHGLPDDERDYSLTSDIKRTARERDDAQALATIRQCMKCYAYFPGDADTCPHCGTPFIVPRNPKIEEEKEVRAVSLSELRELSKPGPNAHRLEHAFLVSQVQARIERNWKENAAWVRFKNKFGRWPSREQRESAENEARRLIERARQRVAGVA